MRALVIDDERSARMYLSELLKEVAVTVVAEAGNIAEAEAALDTAVADVAFVDVRLENEPQPADAGLRLVRSLSKRANAPLVVLSTAFAEHALIGFDLGVVDYLLKPYSEQRIRRCVAKLRTQISPIVVNSSLVAKRKNSLVLLREHEIWAFEAADRLSFVHSIHGKLDLDLSLTSLERLMPSAALRVHRNWLVNPMHVRSFDKNDGAVSIWVGSTLTEGIAVPVARDRVKMLKDLLLGSAHGGLP
jgi:two-component system, LytTR family, response regulator LytT